jgi:hypothetical protein
VIAALALVALLPAAAGAAVHVPAGTRIGELTVFADDVVVDGAVTGSVTVIDGSLLVGPHGELDDRAVVLGGRTTIAPGGQVRGDVVQVGGDWPLPEGPPAVAVIAGLIVVRALVAWLLVAAARLLASRRLTADAADELAVYPLRTLLVGGLALMAAGAAAALLAITVVGLPLTAAIAAAVLLAAALGLAVAVRDLDDDGRAHRVALVALLVPGVGELVAALAAVTGLGAVIRIGSGTPSASLGRV